MEVVVGPEKKQRSSFENNVYSSSNSLSASTKT
jgi:hypothetical protein